jgi:glycosyltransferase involved in cell wall biosynthesis
MAMGLPVVLPGVGGCPEMVKSGITGFIYEPGNLSQFVEQLSLLGADKERRTKMGQEARKFVEETFRFESMVDSYERLSGCWKSKF